MEGEQSPLLAFEKYRALNRLALRTKLNITSAVVAAGSMDAAAGDSDEGDSGSSGSGSMHRRLQKSCKTSGPAECSPNPASCLKCNTTKGAPIYDCLKCCPNCKLKSGTRFTSHFLHESVRSSELPGSYYPSGTITMESSQKALLWKIRASLVCDNFDIQSVCVVAAPDFRSASLHVL